MKPPRRKPNNHGSDHPKPKRDQRAQKPPRAEAGNAAPQQQGERLQKVLAHAGLGSRRACEEFIRQGRITIDGVTVHELGTRVDPARQKVAVDGQPIHGEKLVYYAVCKPKGYVSTNHDPSGRPRVIDLLPGVNERVFAVGRLDESSVGLMILTNDGELANRLAHPRYGVEKVYRAVVAGSPSQDVLDQLVKGVWLAEGKARARRVRIAGKQGEATVLEMVLAEGKNREVRRMLARLGHKVMSLVRVAVGPISLKGLKPGQWRDLTAEEVGMLRRLAAGESVPTAGLGRESRPPGPPRRGPQRPDRAPASGGKPPARTYPPKTAARPDAPPRPGGGRPRLAPSSPSGSNTPPPRRPRRAVEPDAPPGRKIIGMTPTAPPRGRGGGRGAPGRPRPPGGKRPPGTPGQGPPPLGARRPTRRPRPDADSGETS